MVVSAASAWEITTKFRLGKLDFARDLAENFISEVTAAGYCYFDLAGTRGKGWALPGDHKDPFDRMLAAQAIHENIPLLSNDPQLDVFGVRREW